MKKTKNRRAMMESIGLLMIVFTVSIGGYFLMKYGVANVGERTLKYQQSFKAFRDQLASEEFYSDIIRIETGKCLGKQCEKVVPPSSPWKMVGMEVDLDSGELETCIKEKVNTKVDSISKYKNYYAFPRLNYVKVAKQEEDTDFSLIIDTDIAENKIYGGEMAPSNIVKFNNYQEVTPIEEEEQEEEVEEEWGDTECLNITNYSALNFAPENGQGSSVAKIDENHFLTVYQGNGHDGYAKTESEERAGKGWDGWAVVLEVDKYGGKDEKWCCVNGTLEEGEYDWVDYRDAEGKEWLHYAGSESEADNQCGSCNELCTSKGYESGEETKNQGYATCNQWDHCSCNNYLNAWGVTNYTAFAFEEEGGVGATTLARITEENLEGEQLRTVHFLAVYSGKDEESYTVVLEVDTTDWSVTKPGNRLGLVDDYVGNRLVQGSSYNSVVKLDDTHYLNFYQIFYPWGGGSYGMDGVAVVLEVDPDTWDVTMKSEHLYNPSMSGYAAGGSAYNSPVKINESDEFVNVLNTFSAYGDYVGVFRVNKTDWSVKMHDRRKALLTSHGNYNSMAKIDNDHYISTHGGSEYEDNMGQAAMFTLGSNFSLSIPTYAFQFDSKGWYNSLTSIDKSHYLNAYGGEDDDGWAVVLTVNKTNNAIAKCNAFEFDSRLGIGNSLVQIDKTHYLNVYSGEPVTRIKPFEYLSVKYYRAGWAVVLELNKIE